MGRLNLIHIFVFILNTLLKIFPHHFTLIDLKHFRSNLYIVRLNSNHRSFRTACMKILVPLRNRRGSLPTHASAEEQTQDVLWQAGRHLAKYLGSAWRERTDLLLRDFITVTGTARNKHLVIFFLKVKIVLEWKMACYTVLRSPKHQENVELVPSFKACFVILQSLIKRDQSIFDLKGNVTVLNFRAEK